LGGGGRGFSPAPAPVAFTRPSPAGVCCRCRYFTTTLMVRDFDAATVLVPA
jgi:hypothetical protein